MCNYWHQGLPTFDVWLAKSSAVLARQTSKWNVKIIIVTAVTWLEYGRYGVKPQALYQSNYKPVYMFLYYTF